MVFEYKEFPLNLDLVEGTSAQSSNKKISLSQRDIGVSKILFSLTFRNVAYPIPAGAKVRLFIKRYNSGIVMQDQTPETGAHVSVTDGANGKIEVLLNSDSIANAGQAEAQIEIELAPGKIMTSQKFSFFIESALGANGEVISGNDIPLLDRALEVGTQFSGVNINEIIDISKTIDNLKAWIIGTAVNPKLPPFNASFNGTDETSKIQDAINYAKNNGINRVVLPATNTPAGISLENPLIIPSDFTIFGIGDGYHLKPVVSTSRNFNTVVENGYTEQFLYGKGSVISSGDIVTKKNFLRTSKGKNITIHNVNIDGVQSQIDKTNLRDLGNHYGINIQNVVGLTITKCKVNNCVGTGIFTYVVSKALIAFNECNDNGNLPLIASNRNGISVGGSAADINEDVYIFKNICKNNLNAGIMFGVYNRIILEDNILIGNKHKGIEGDNHFSSTSQTLKAFVTIKNNVIEDTLMTAIEVAAGNGSKVTIQGNKIRGYGNDGIAFQQKDNSILKISDNDVLEGGIGLTGDITSGSTTITNVTNIYYWQQENAGVGSTIVGSGIPSGATITAIDKVNNILTLSVAATATITGVSIMKTNYHILNLTGHEINVHDNTLIGHKTGAALSVLRTDKFNAHDNNIEDTKQDAFYLGLNSLQLGNVDFIKIKNNTLKTIGRCPVYLSTNDSSKVIRSLQIEGNAIYNPLAYTGSILSAIHITGNSSITNMNVSENDIFDSNTTKKADYGLFMDSSVWCTRGRVNNNDFTNTKNVGIWGTNKFAALKVKGNFGINDIA
jgi:BppU N-terminal domain/Right handed beta helix region